MTSRWLENPEDRLIQLLQYMEDELPHFFSGTSGPVKLRDWRSGFCIATIWAPFAPQFSDLFFEALKQASSQDAESRRETATRVALGRALGEENPFWVGDVELEPLAEEPSSMSNCPRDALFEVWLFGRPSAAARGRRRTQLPAGRRHAG
ncbi:hypothetical protein [Anaeromyxobacter dehalogenans]|uniref:hypothetical protein n=1 Tax=Anaeromyxobacter dehalogenans TaxID=161493 RepID=UPI0012ED6FDB|nr:hypothetical protein [Anaeromyxobacter dehalogenans]